MQLKQNLLISHQVIVVPSAAKSKASVFTPNGFAAILVEWCNGNTTDFDSVFNSSNLFSTAKGMTMPLYENILVPVCKNVGSRPYSSFGQESCKPYRAVGLYGGPRLPNLEQFFYKR